MKKKVSFECRNRLAFPFIFEVCWGCWVILLKLTLLLFICFINKVRFTKGSNFEREKNEFFGQFDRFPRSEKFSQGKDLFNSMEEILFSLIFLLSRKMFRRKIITWNSRKFNIKTVSHWKMNTNRKFSLIIWFHKNLRIWWSILSATITIRLDELFFRLSTNTFVKWWDRSLRKRVKFGRNFSSFVERETFPSCRDVWLWNATTSMFDYPENVLHPRKSQRENEKNLLRCQVKFFLLRFAKTKILYFCSAIVEFFDFHLFVGDAFDRRWNFLVDSNGRTIFRSSEVEFIFSRFFFWISNKKSFHREKALLVF